VALPIALDPLVTAASRVALVVDFDGSLAPIVDDPSRAHALPAALDALTRLVPLLGRVGVISGRPVAFLAAEVPVAGIELVGLYGLERAIDGEIVVDERVAPWLDAIADAADEAEAALPGVLVERKGAVSFTLHYRAEPERADEVRACAVDLSRRYGLDAPQRGRMAIELRPPVPVDKGTAVTEMVHGSAVAAFAGDDAGDLPAFDALVQLASEGTLEHAVRIGVRSSEAPPEILAADVVVDGPTGLTALLQDLAQAISERG
jgi:trehalose 6-phosphate phosphatase